MSFRTKDDSWTEPGNLGPVINEKYNERYPYVSPDGKYLFFVSDKVNARLTSKDDFSYTELQEMYLSPGNGWSDVYWVDAKIINELKPGELK